MSSTLLICFVILSRFLSFSSLLLQIPSFLSSIHHLYYASFLSSFHLSLLFSFLPSFLPSLHPSFLPFFLHFVLPFFFLSFLTSFLPFFLHFVLPSILLFFLTSLLVSSLHFILPSFHPSFLSLFPSLFLPIHYSFHTLILPPSSFLLSSFLADFLLFFIPCLLAYLLIPLYLLSLLIPSFLSSSQDLISIPSFTRFSLFLTFDLISLPLSHLSTLIYTAYHCLQNFS